MGYPTANATTGAKFDLSANGSRGGGPAGGQQVTLWNFTTATYFNGKTVTVLDNDPATGTFRFYFTHADVGSTADAGNTAAIPVERYRKVRIEAGQANTAAGLVYVGDLNVSSTRYIAALTSPIKTATLPYFQTWILIEGDNIPADRIFIDGTNSGDTVQVSLYY
jgi:hypothetical protein